MSSSFCDRTYNDIIIDLPNREVSWCCKTHLVEGEEPQVIFDKDNLDYDFLFNHPLLEQRQRALENNIKHPHCNACWKAEKESGGKYSFRKENTPKNDKRKFSFIEISVTNTCNMACKYCDPRYSTKWQGLVGQKYDDTDPELLEIVCDLVIEYYKKELHDVPMVIFNMMGGEPLMSSHTHYFINKVISYINNNKHFPEQIIHVMYTTNYNFSKSILQKYIDYAETFKDIGFIFHISNEAVGPRAEFVRTNLDYEKWISNVRYTFEKSQELDNLKIMFGCAHSAMTLPYFKEFLYEMNRLAKNTNFTKEVVFMSNVVRYPQFMDVGLLGSHYYEPMNDIIDYFKNMELNVRNFDIYLNFLEGLRDEMIQDKDIDRKMVTRSYMESKNIFDYGNYTPIIPHFDILMGF